MGEQSDRREFFKNAGRVGTTFVFLGSLACKAIHVQPRQVPPSGKLNCAGVGAGGKGGDDIRNAGRTENVVALCDCDENQAAKSREQFPNAKFYFDFREMLEKHEKDIDAVTVGTPDHIHAPAAVMAMRMGKHVYVQKPLCRTVWECREMLKTAREKGVATQMGNQGTASDGLRRGVEVVRSGAIGKVREVHVWTNRPIWPQGLHRPTRIDPIPDNLKWELFLGPAPWRPYVGDKTYHPFSWRGWWDYGTGALGDMACHTMNLPFLALKLGYPTAIEAQSSELFPENAPKWSIIKYEFPAREDLPALTLTWHDGGKKPPAELFELGSGKDIPGGGSLMIGDKGKMFSGGDYGTDHQLWPRKAFEGYQAPEPTLPRAPGGDSYREWIAACKGGPKAMSNFEYSAFLTEVVVLGNLAVRLGKKVEWDGPNMKSPNAPEADQLIKPYIPKGWVL